MLMTMMINIYLLIFCILLSKVFLKIRIAKNIKSKSESNLYYKYEDEYIAKDSDYVSIFKLPLYEKELELLENKDEPIYKMICLISSEKYYKIVDYINKTN